MKKTIYIKVAKTKNGYKFKLDLKKNWKPLDNGVSDNGFRIKKYYPTTLLKVNIEIPDEEIGILKEYEVSLK